MNDPNGPVVRIDGLTKRFRKKLALDNVSMSVDQGSVVGLLGENGAGKTTAIRILLGLLEADAGRAEVLGMDPRRRGHKLRRRVGYVPEQPCLYEWMTVAEIGWFAAGFYSNGYMQEYHRLIDHLKLPPEQRIKELSKGMRAKVSLALAVAADTPLLILDEPTSGLDLMVRYDFLESMVEMAGQGRTLLFSSHHVAEVERVADWIAILHDGRLLTCQPLDRLKEDVRELVLTLSESAGELDALPGEVICQEQSGRQWRIIGRGFTADALAELRRRPEVQDAVLRTLSLEEIYVAYMQSTAA
jgi:ABC-2 type transport system ATP-binding protein